MKLVRLLCLVALIAPLASVISCSAGRLAQGAATTALNAPSGVTQTTARTVQSFARLFSY